MTGRDAKNKAFRLKMEDAAQTDQLGVQHFCKRGSETGSSKVGQTRISTSDLRIRRCSLQSEAYLTFG